MSAAGVRTDFLRPGDDRFDTARSAYNLNARQSPAIVVLAQGADDVRAAVRRARAEDLGVAVMATGHGVAAPWEGGLLVNTSRMRRVHIDPPTRRARVEAGAKWSDLAPWAAAHGLAGLPGSSSGVGVVGYTMGGGFGWLGRKYGFAASSVVEAQVVTADGEQVRANATENADLFWGLKGGGGNFGIVTELEFALHPVADVYAGNLYYPVERAREVLECYAQWYPTLPDEMASAVAFRNFPPLPAVPEQFRGRSFITVRGCFCGTDLREGERLTTRVRDALGVPAIDTFGVLSAAMLDRVSLDPVDPVGAYTRSETVRDLSPATIGTLVELGTGAPLIMLELRALGGALWLPATDLSPMAHTDAPFSLNAIGATVPAGTGGTTQSPESDRVVRDYLAHVARTIAPHTTGTTYVNFMDLHSATPQRVRAAYSAGDWDRLVALKGRWDPQNVFRFNRNVPPPPAGGNIPPPAGPPPWT